MIELYTKLFNDRLKYVDLRVELQKCCGDFCSNHHHKSLTNELCNQFVSILKLAASSAYCVNRRRHGKCVVGRNVHVGTAHGKVKVKCVKWKWYGCPKSGPIYDDMIQAKPIFKGRRKWC